MDVMWIVAVAMLGVLGAAISRLMADEFKAWVPWMIRLIIDRAVRTLPEDRRERFTEEWRSHVNEIPGDAGKLIVALGLLVASMKMARIPAAAGKRILDAVISTAMLVLVLPLMVVVGLAIKLDSPGPVLSFEKRIGRNGKRFRIFKFRTALTGSRHRGRLVTRFGRFLRKTNIDELPQLFNVLSGTMSLVGPRPRAPFDNGMVIHDVKPGITGWAQVNDNRGEARPPDIEASHDVYYADNWSPLLDLKILIRMVFSALKRRDKVD